ncbi:WH1 domain protein, putative (macronuclear) [Tetrahymena thermophila SB210]|uniref:WH1 domain protein, putative n=1 Tax=Tetrahymena thermophila (strain SB210) TaxID=312017 RepID=Q22CN0_TETTS|nr:WH1 domain protein, putative [Tetrahymena thermophila SB210]EAR83022.1 WH1 domain protein, putative [Tetrahymena thermophila SB210]|eukprot:XP_001030685.1 WH1 domain protein, putative [Tetrahymena thermophila SB210]
MNLSVSRDIFDHIKQRMGQQIEIRFIAACRIWFFSNNRWSFSNLQGGLALGLDKSISDELKEGRDVFYMFDLNTFDVTFRLYLYKFFHEFYFKLNDFFYYFRLSNTQTLIGFSFSNKQEADLLYQEIQFITDQEKELKEIEEMNYPELAQDSKLRENFENDKPLQDINIEKEETRLLNGKLKKAEKDILRKAGVSKKDYENNVGGIKNNVINEFLSKYKRKKEIHENMIQQKQQFQPISNPEANFEMLRKNSVINTQNAALIHVSQTNANTFQSTSRLRQSSTTKTSMIKQRNSTILGAAPIIPQAPPLVKLLENDSGNQQTLNAYQSQGNSSLIAAKPKIIAQEVKQSLMEEIKGMKYKLKPVTKVNPLVLTKEESISLTYKINAQIRERRKELKKNFLDEDQENSPWDSLDEEND